MDKGEPLAQDAHLASGWNTDTGVQTREPRLEVLAVVQEGDAGAGFGLWREMEHGWEKNGTVEF